MALGVTATPTMFINGQSSRTCLDWRQAGRRTSIAWCAASSPAQPSVAP